MRATEEFDYVVVGAGSSGCVVAARLSESGTHNVALFEAGGEDDNFWIHVPLGFGKLYDNPKYNWLYEGEPEPGLAGGKSFQPRGKVLGGTGSINGHIYQRGQREDYDYWRQLGNVGWSYDEVLPYFKKAEDNERGADAFYGAGGPLTVSNCPRDELGDAFIDAALQAGYSRNVHGFNGRCQEGFDYNQMSIRNGRRCSTAVAYLHPARRRNNLSVIVGALATRILFKDGAARGIEFRRNGITQTVLARREVILAGGAFNSPQLLQISGVGPADLLSEFNIPLVANLPGVGENLQDHIGAGMTYQCSRPITVNDIVNNPLRRLAAGIQYVLFRKGLLASSAGTAAGMIRTDPALSAPDVKLQVTNWNRTLRGQKKLMGLSPLSSFSVGMKLMHPENRGAVRIKSADGAAAPEIRFNCFVSERDQRIAVAALRVIRHIMAMPAIAPYIVQELTPGPQCSTDSGLIDHVRQHANFGGHCTGTCRMGIDDMAVVDPRLRLRGVERLRVIDASVMPRIVAANTNATAIMIAEKGSAMVIEDAKAI